LSIYFARFKTVLLYEGTKENNMTARQVHDMLKEDAAYIWSRNNQDAVNMMIVLAAHGLNSTIDHALIMIQF